MKRIIILICSFLVFFGVGNIVFWTVFGQKKVETKKYRTSKANVPLWWKNAQTRQKMISLKSRLTELEAKKRLEKKKWYQKSKHEKEIKEIKKQINNLEKRPKKALFPN